MLRDDQETNARIAIACGFSSPENLEQAIREKTGHTPKYFRKRQTS